MQRMVAHILSLYMLALFVTQHQPVRVTCTISLHLARNPA
jgi:hypothetical protein